jgi:hypothetical protein
MPAAAHHGSCCAPGRSTERVECARSSYVLLQMLPAHGAGSARARCCRRSRVVVRSRKERKPHLRGDAPPERQQTPQEPDGFIREDARANTFDLERHVLQQGDMPVSSCGQAAFNGPRHPLQCGLDGAVAVVQCHGTWARAPASPRLRSSCRSSSTRADQALRSLRISARSR